MGNRSTKAVWGAVLGLVIWGQPFGAHAADQAAKLDKALERPSSSDEPTAVIIRAKAGRESAVTNKVAHRSDDVQTHTLIGALSAKLTRREIAELVGDPDVEGISLDADVSALASSTGTNNGNKGGPGTPTASSGASSTSTVIADLRQTLGVGNRFTGSNVTVAVIDSGIASSPDFDSRLIAQYVFLKGRQYFTGPYDDYGHGTHVAGLIGSSGASSNNKYAGIAPAVKLLSLKVLDSKGTGKTSDVINALEFAVANKTRFGLNIINLSLGHPIYEPATTDPLVQAVEAAARAGIIVVVAAGNYGYNPITGATGYAGIASPGNSPSAITVGAAATNNTLVRADDRLADYSSRGPTWFDGFAKPDVLAPGQALVSNDAVGSTLDTSYPSLVLKSGATKFLRLSGSSMATGVVSGLVATMLDASRAGAEQRWLDYENSLKRNLRSSFVPPPSLSANAVKALLEYSATPLRNDSGATYGPLEQGAGLVNGLGATTLAYNIDAARGAGAYWLTTDVAPSTTFGGIDEAWSQTVIWGLRLLHGTSVVDLHQAAWEDNVVWGTGALGGVLWGMFSDDEDNIVWGTFVDEDNIVWGTSLPLSTTLTWAGNAGLEDNIVWGTSVMWAENIVWGSGFVGYFNGQNIVWGTLSDNEDNVVWGTLDEDNIVWGTSANRVTALGMARGGVQ